MQNNQQLATSSRVEITIKLNLHHSMHATACSSYVPYMCVLGDRITAAGATMAATPFGQVGP